MRMWRGDGLGVSTPLDLTPKAERVYFDIVYYKTSDSFNSD